MGTLYLRNGVYHANYFDRAGKRQRRSTRTADRAVAKVRLRELELATTDRGQDPTQALADAIDYFVDVVCASSPAGTLRCYRQKGRHLARLLGEVLLDELTREHVERYIATRLDEGAHTHSVHKELVVLRGALAGAETRGLFDGRKLVPRFAAGYEPRRTHHTPEQFLALADHLVAELPDDAPDEQRETWTARRNRRVLYCLLIALASPRKGELEAMSWEQHVHLARGVLIIPKGKTVGRPVAIHPQLRPWLEALEQEAGPVVDPWPNVVRDLAAACKRAGVPRVTPNDLRRTFASWLVQAGVSNLIVSRLLGHSSTRMVDLVYGQLDERTLAAAIGALPGARDAGVTDTVLRGGTHGTHGTGASPTSLTISVEESAISTTSVVPRDGIEPPTRGFSVPLPDDLKQRARSQKPRKLRAV